MTITNALHVPCLLIAVWYICHTLAGECRAKTEQAQEQKPAKAKAERGSASKAPARTPASSDAKPKPRAKPGMDKTEKDVHHVLYKVIGQVSACLLGAGLLEERESNEMEWNEMK